MYSTLFFFNATATTEIYTFLHTCSLHDALPISLATAGAVACARGTGPGPARSGCRRPGRGFAGLDGTPGHSAGIAAGDAGDRPGARSEEHTSELQSLMRISYAVFCLKKKIHYYAYCGDDNDNNDRLSNVR